ncbi:U11/U12 small nuclear ribonucleoprotein 59 kDa protein isoform X1 [Nicotiana sylvestris]|uniref:U11/U12 small nuclear ribonucleoprotein 59 kDa protein isoform X1 n=2 Tax=Nicotiana sylvestris TaxID=4096 RepID=A0A1U7X5X1_NICSY|nr:PREDICTED: U11/U12 small nuclear ribonucleoprotein 59 kDa protein isoform X1 [Nicotiana sylvestris]XP_009787492.1 PREDICTED: U11/U12 small nuclear ribonucleoprotein 59 kDa protein isoform X1 [Nicotiana sylvestris]
MQYPMNPPGPPQYGRPLPPPLPAFPPASSTFWNAANVVDHLKNLHDTMNLATALKKELEMLSRLKDEKEKSEEGSENGAGEGSIDSFVKFMEHSRINMKSQESLSLEAANTLISKLRAQLEPFRVITDEMVPWEEKSAAVRLVNKMHKYKRNKLWRKRKRKHVAEKLAKEREQFDQIDMEADEWRAREIAKDIAKRKVEKMKEIAKLKEKQEKKRLESELELALMVEKLQELRSIRVQKLKKQGHFLPEEDDKFLERVRAAVEEEERQAKAAAETDAAKDAIATAEESRKTIQSHRSEPGDLHANTGTSKINQDQTTESKDKSGSTPVNEMEKGGPEGLGSASLHDSVANLPLEFYHYYYGSNHDLGTLIEVRRTWDAYIRPGGSRIPGHWVQPPPPADEIWASYLVKPK